MAIRHNRLVAAIGLASVAALAAMLLVFWLAGAFDRGPEVDGEAILDQPGIYQQPLDDVNDDVAGKTVPDVGLETAAGAPVELSAYRGQPLVVNLWFSNCPPCQRELPDFETVHNELGDRVRFIGVDPFDTIEAMQRFAEARGVTYELLRDPEREFTNAIGVVAFPVTLFVDADGRIVRQTGEIDADGLREAIDELF